MDKDRATGQPSTLADENRRTFLRLGFGGAVTLGAIGLISPGSAAGGGGLAVTVDGRNILVGGRPIKLKGLRLSNALISEQATSALIERGLDIYRGYGINMISVYLMGSRFGGVKGYERDGALNSVYSLRLARIIEACAARGMIVLVGCLYWGDAKASDHLAAWGQADANKAVANTVKWLTDNNYTNVFVDPDNEGMARLAKGWDIGEMIDAGHAANPRMVMAFNAYSFPSKNADILIHHTADVGMFGRPRPYVDTEGTPPPFMVGEQYWAAYSRGDRTDGYVNIGVYTYEMKEALKQRATWGIENEGGYVLASTWLQAPDAPHDNPGGQGTKDDPGVRWWLEYIKERHGGD